MPRQPEIGNVTLYPKRPLRKGDRNGYVLKFYCPIKGKRIRKACGTRDIKQARRILRECRERLINGEYVESGGAITKAQEQVVSMPVYVRGGGENPSAMSFDEAFQRYRDYKESRVRKQSFQSLCSGIEMSRRIFEARRANDGLAPGATLQESLSLEGLEFLQKQLRDGAEGRYEHRLPATVNSILGDVMAFARYCFKHDWIAKVPPIEDLDEAEVTRGRAITGEEFDRMLAAAPQVVGASAAASWIFLLKTLWESGFRIADILNFYWDDETKIHPRWASRRHEHTTVVIPSTQKNKKFEEIPMLPGLERLLKTVPEDDRVGRVIKLEPVEYAVPGKREGAFCPSESDLERLIVDYTNKSIAACCKVSDRTVGVWLRKLGLERRDAVRFHGQPVPEELAHSLRKRARRRRSRWTRLSKDRVSRIISAIGEEAGIIVRNADEERRIRIKYASAHDLRRSLAERLYNKGMTAETLMVIMRHRDFATTRKFYQAKKRAEAAAAEVHKLLGGDSADQRFVGGFVGGHEKTPQLSAEELLKLKRLLNSL